ncbi:MAG: arginine--tRNA ligase [Cyclobacteriaceae bacterium]
MDISVRIKSGIANAFEALYQHDLKSDNIALQPTRKEFDGSHTFVTFPFGRISGKNPQATGEEIGSYLKEHTTWLKSYNVVKGFLNLELADTIWLNTLKSATQTPHFGFTPQTGEKVMVEYSSPNTNKPLHLGHLRNNFLGYSVSNILEANGYEVMKVNLVNDRGIHICKSMLAYDKFGNGETPESAGMKGDHLIGKYYVIFDQKYKVEIAELEAEGHSREHAEKHAPLILAAQEMLKKWEEGDDEVVALWEKLNGWVYEGFDKTYQKMGVSFDKMYKESNTYLLGKDIVEEGLEKGVFFKKEDNSVWADLSAEKLDEKLILRGDGTSVYITQDMGTCDMKYNDLEFSKSLYVVGNEQDYHFKVLFTIMQKLGRPYGDGLYHLSYGMVDLPSGKMKSREGTVVDADDLMAEMVNTAKERTIEKGKIENLSEEEANELYQNIGLGALKYFLLKVDPKKRMLFDPEESIELQGNTGPFVQYTHARVSSIGRRAKELGIKPEVNEDVTLEPSETAIIALLNEYPDKIALAGQEYSPSIIAQYVYDVAKAYNRFFQEVPIFNEDDNDKVALRVALSSIVGRVIKSALGLLGIEAPERM